MKQEILFIWSFLLLLCLGACQKEAVSSEDVAANEGITLELVTRANDNVEAGDDRFNENLITKADVFFFEKEDEAAVCVYSQIGVTPSENKIKVKLDNFDEGSYYVYVIANGNFTYNNNGVGVTLGELKGMPAYTMWSNSQTESEPSLLMDGGNICQVKKNGTGSVALTRAMAKVTLSVTATEIEEDDGTYVPQLSGMYVSMVNIVNRTNLKGDYQVNSSKDYLKMNERIIRKYQQSETGEYYHVPFYSYPNPENTVNREDAYLILKLPWKKVLGEGGGNYDAVDYYYQVPITGSDALALCSRNHYYKLNLTVGVLGSLNPQTPVEVTPSFIIEDWFTEELTAEMQNYRYLVLDEYNSVMNNVNELRMPYVSSSAIDFDSQKSSYTRITQVKYWDYHNDKSYEVILNENYKKDTQNPKSTVNFDDFHLDLGDNNTLKFTHVLTDEDFVPYIITIQVVNQQGIETNTWTITQYPDIYIVGENNEKYGSKNRFVNGSMKGDNDRDQSIGGVSSLSGTNSNPNQYTIFITSFDVGSSYAIGDPREEASYDFQSYLKPTNYKRTSPDYEDVISPVFKVASSWGKTFDISYDKAVQRCAAYQENGYPAGRWRIPTKAEVEFCISLSEQGKIPRLFGQQGSSTDYWVSSGYYNTDNGYTHQERPSGERYVRCVYDVWYWSDKKINEVSSYDNNTFVWGDKGNDNLYR